MTIQDTGMPAIFEEGIGIHYYVPPPPRPAPPAGTSIPDFGQAVSVAQRGAAAYQTGHSAPTVENDWTVEVIKVENDCTSAGTIMANQYQIAWTSSDPEAAVAALDRQYADYFQNNGTDSRSYNELVAAAKGAVQGEITDQQKAQIQRLDANREPASLTAETTDLEAAGLAVEQADINATLQAKYGKGNDGAYTVAQIEAALTALGQADPAVAPLINFLAANMEERRTLKDVLAVLQTKGLKLVPAEIKSGSLGTIKLAPAEFKLGTLTLTPAEAQLAEIDPVMLALLLKADGDTVTQQSPQMAQLAPESPSLFAHMELNGVNVSVDTPEVEGPIPTPGRMAYDRSNGSVPISKGKPNNASPAEVMDLYECGNATSEGAGLHLATVPLDDLPVNPMTAGGLAGIKFADIASLMISPGVGGVASQFASGAVRFGQTANLPTFMASYGSAMLAWREGHSAGHTAAAVEGGAIPPANAAPVAAMDENEVPPATPGLPAVVSRFEALTAVYSGPATSHEWTKERLEFAGCGLHAAHMGNQLCSFNDHRGNASREERLQAVVAVAQGIPPFVMEPVIRGIGRSVKARFGRADTRVSPTAVELKVQPGAWRLGPEGGFLWWIEDDLLRVDGGEVAPDGPSASAFEAEPPPASGS